MLKPEIQWGGGYSGRSRSASRHRHEHGGPKGFSRTASFSYKKTDCCLDIPRVSLETGSWGLCAPPLNPTPARPRPSPSQAEWIPTGRLRGRGGEGRRRRLGALAPPAGRGALLTHPAPGLGTPPRPLIVKAVWSRLLQFRGQKRSST